MTIEVFLAGQQARDDRTRSDALGRQCEAADQIDYACKSAQTKAREAIGDVGGAI
jgi:hypothetical protein